MTQALLECVPNISAGRDVAAVNAVVAAIAGVPGALVLDQTSDADHNRSVITFAGSPDAVASAAFEAVRESAKRIDLAQHSGIHPRVGALDVLPFVPVQGMSLQECVAIANQVGERIWNELRIPVYFYEAAARRPERRRLENVRRGEFEGLREAVLQDAARQPDLGGPSLHPTAGAVIVGARPFLIAFNVNLKTIDVELARSIAARVRERDGGFPGIKALGLRLASRELVQVSLNITNFQKTSVLEVFSEVERLAGQRGVQVEESELVGLIPRAALDSSWLSRLKLREFSSSRILENRIAEVQETDDSHF